MRCNPSQSFKNKLQCSLENCFLKMPTIKTEWNLLEWTGVRYYLDLMCMTQRHACRQTAARFLGRFQDTIIAIAKFERARHTWCKPINECTGDGLHTKFRFRKSSIHPAHDLYFKGSMEHDEKFSTIQSPFGKRYLAIVFAVPNI